MSAAISATAAIAIGATAAIGAGASIYAANKQSDALKNAAQTQQNMYNTTSGEQAPYRTLGSQASSQLADLEGISGNTGAAGYGSLNQPFTAKDYLANQDPGYQFQLQTGAQATRNADTPGVGSLSGAALKDLIGFNQNMAATGYQNAFNRYQTQQTNSYNRLSNLANLGENATANTGQVGSQLGQGIASAQAAQGAASASGATGFASSLSSGANTLGGLAYLSSINNPPSTTLTPTGSIPAGANFDGSVQT